jgi:beta-phosphoglucomutase-like phosphatase (HAD superfamily)
MYKAAIFDLDGLLIDSERAIRDAWLEVARRNRVALTEAEYLQVVGRNEADSKAILGEIFGGSVSFEEARAGVEILLTEGDVARGYGVKPGAVALLTQLRARAVPCGVASSTRKSEVRRRLELSALLAFFGAICGGDEVAKGKPSPDVFLLAGERLGIEPEHCLVFEDSEHGVIGAVAAGMSAVVVPDLKAPNAEVRASCVAVLESLDQALPLCDAWFAAGEVTSRSSRAD